MKNKIKSYFRDKNPYLLASVAIVVVSIAVIIALLQEEPSEEIRGESVIAESVVEITESVDVHEDQSVEVTLEKEDLPDHDLESTKFEEEVENEVTVESSEAYTENTNSESKELEIEEAEVELTEPESVPESTDQEEGPIQEPEETHDSETEPEEDQEEAPEPVQHVHSWIFKSYYQEPTCSNGGLEMQICAHCGETQITNGTPTGKHDFAVEKQADCCSSEVVVCVECNYREIRDKDEQKHIDVEDGFCYGCGHTTE